MTLDLFAQPAGKEIIAPGACLLRGLALARESAIWQALQSVIAQAPLRHMQTPGGLTMSVAMSNCGPLGWVSDRQGYRYQALDPLSQQPWPAMPAEFMALAQQAAILAGFADFTPDACLINQYAVGAKLSLHQDKDERDQSHPIVSVSLGLPATFQFGGLQRSDKLLRTELQHGDVVVWGGPSRLRYHGILPLKSGTFSYMGTYRYNLTFRRAS
ncbi:DNA oxidative demethylase AlkB [Methylobacillus glycogenes]|uniref:DNA oxidative demethylase AlkB n=1 Tax=Methylobacillus glycogenes TaxID=406 RepID=UPI00047136DD|nr:DNA oxidative demethylase AlkB [Methylobacillus glycogenes]